MTRHDTVHVVHGACLGPVLASAIRQERRAIAAIVDDFSYGPLHAFVDARAFWSTRAAFWQSAGDEDAAPERFVVNERRLARAHRVVLWIGTCLGEQLLLAWMPSFLRSLGIDPDQLRVVQLPRLSLADSPKRDIIAAPGPKWPRSVELSYLDEAFRAVVSPDPTTLVRFLQTTNPHLVHMRPALRKLIDRYPGIDTGLSVPEEMLLACVRDHGPSAVRIIAHTMSKSYDTGDPVGDAWLFWRLQRLASAPNPAVILTGARTSMRGTEARLTELGHEILAGRAHFARLNGIDDWIAGVHLDSRAGATWIRADPDTLALDSHHYGVSTSR